MFGIYYFQNINNHSFNWTICQDYHQKNIMKMSSNLNKIWDRNGKLKKFQLVNYCSLFLLISTMPVIFFSGEIWWQDAIKHLIWSNIKWHIFFLKMPTSHSLLKVLLWRSPNFPALLSWDGNYLEEKTELSCKMRSEQMPVLSEMKLKMKNIAIK